MNKYNFLIICTALSFIFIGCAQPPKAERSAARAALSAARAAGADRYVAGDFNAAQMLWDTAESEVKEKKYEEAKKDYINATAAFEKAAGAVESVKKAMIPEAAAAVASLEEGWTNLQAAAKKAEGKMGKSKLWEVDSQSFLDGLKAAKGMVATDPAGVKAKAQHLQRFLDVYGATFKQMAANPAKLSPRKRNPGAAKEE